MRAVAKIAFNYLAYHYPAISTMEQFSEITRYIRFAEQPQRSPVSILQESILGDVPADRQLLVHTLTCAWEAPESKVVAQVSLFSWVQYRVVLADSAFLVPPLCIDSGHIFDPMNRQIVPVSRKKHGENRPAIPMVRRQR